MIHWAKFVFGVLLAFSLIDTILGCYDDDVCGYGECCDGGICSSCNTSSSSSLSAGVIAVIIVVAVIFKVSFWIMYCYCRSRRAGVILVRNPYMPFQNTASTVVVSNQITSSSTYPPPPYPPPQQRPGFSHPQAQPPPHVQQHTAYPPPQQQQQHPQQQHQPGGGFAFPQQTVPVRDDIAMSSGVNAPPAYTEKI